MVGMKTTSIITDKTIIKIIVLFRITTLEVSCIEIHRNLLFDRSKFYLRFKRTSISRMSQLKRRKSVLSPFLSERTSRWSITRQMGPPS